MEKKATFFLIFLLLASSLSAETERKKDTPPLNSLQKSLLLPGWGQVAEKRYMEGFLFFAGEIFCLYGFFDQNHKGNRSYALYRAATNREDAVRYRRDTEVFDTRRNGFLLATAVVWAVNLVDIYWIVSGRNKDKDKSGRSISFRLDCGEGQKLAVALSYRY